MPTAQAHRRCGCMGAIVSPASLCLTKLALVAAPVRLFIPFFGVSGDLFWWRVEMAGVGMAGLAGTPWAVPGTALYTDVGCTSRLHPGGWPTERQRVQHWPRFCHNMITMTQTITTTQTTEALTLGMWSHGKVLDIFCWHLHHASDTTRQHTFSNHLYSWTLQPVTSSFLQFTPQLTSHPPTHTLRLPPHNRTLLPVTHDITPDPTPSQRHDRGIYNIRGGRSLYCL